MGAEYCALSMVGLADTLCMFVIIDTVTLLIFVNSARIIFRNFATTKILNVYGSISVGRRFPSGIGRPIIR
jgi:hypothetical protein